MRQLLVVPESDTASIERSLEALVVDNADFNAIGAAMNVFCPFDAIGMSRQEVRHGFFLSYMLDPSRPHGLGSECLRALMRAAAAVLSRGVQGIAPLDVHLMELDGAIVRREYDAIDLVVELPREKLIVAIELKIDAIEHSGQLGRYRRIVERRWPAYRHLLLFLTKGGTAPSESDGAGWQAVPLSAVADAFLAVAERGDGGSMATLMVKAYVGMLRRDHLTDERMEALAAGLWRQHREALDFLMARRPDDRYARLAILLDRRDEAASKLSAQTGLTIVGDHSTKSNVRFAVADWDGFPIMLTASGWTQSRRLLLIEVKESGGIMRAQWVLGPGPERQRLFDAFRDARVDIGGNHGIGEKWRQLANQMIPADEGDTAEDAFERSVAMIGDFVIAHARSYADVIATL